MQWIFLILASCCEICWFYCIAYLNKLSWKELSTFSFMQSDNWYWILTAIVGYAAFGVANMVFFAKAIQKIAPAIAFAAWTGLALAGITISDMVWKEMGLNLWQGLSILSILAGIVGVKILSDKP